MTDSAPGSAAFPFRWEQVGDTVMIHGVDCVNESVEPRTVTIRAHREYDGE